MAALIELVSDFVEMERQLMESGGELTPAIEDMMAINQGDIKTKVDRYKLFMDSLDARAAYFKGIEEQAAAARRMFASHKERLKQNMKFVMRNMATREIAGHDFRFVLSALKPKMVVNEAELPPEYWKEQITKVVDYEKIEKDCLLGSSVKGVTIEDVDSLRNYLNHAGRAKPVKEKGAISGK